MVYKAGTLSNDQVVTSVFGKYSMPLDAIRITLLMTDHVV